MSKVQRKPNELIVRLNQQIDLLELACFNFDQGKEIVGLHIATIIRVLLHDTNSSTSLLKQLNLKNIDFLNTSFDIINEKESIHLGLVIKYIGTINDGVGGPVLYKPIFTSDFHLDKVKKKPKYWNKFQDWWKEKIFINPNGASLTRKQIVLYLSNQEGGAHIDPKINQDFDAFRHSYSSGIVIIGSTSGIRRDFDNIPVLPAIREIAFEVIESFKKARFAKIGSRQSTNSTTADICLLPTSQPYGVKF